MKAPNITSGEWGTFIPSERHNPSSEKRVLVLHPDGERLIADTSVGYCNLKGVIPIEEREANARLIAAAPKLAEALEAARDSLEHLAIASKAGGYMDVYRQARACARVAAAALASAGWTE